MKKEDIGQLLKKYKAGTASPDEIAFLESWYAQYQQAQPGEYSPGQLLADSAIVEKQLHQRLFKKKTPGNHQWLYAVAAIFIVALSTSLYFHSHIIVNHTSEMEVKEIEPGGNKATLTLSDGTKINLDSDKKGIQINDEKISYNDGTGINPAKLHSSAASRTQSSNLYNSLSTPRGGIYQIILPDGTKVWLNAASTLKYPAKFMGSKREVFLTGEAYFDVAKSQDAANPFIVRSKNQAVQVLGTSFNISAFEDESAIRTTLVNGTVQVIGYAGANNLQQIADSQLAPGEESVIQANGKLSKTKADIASALAWKQGLFVFKKETLASIMKQIARWYDVQVTYDTDVDQNELYGGSFSRSSALSSVLRKLSLTGGITYKIEPERRVLISRKKDQ